MDIAFVLFTVFFLFVFAVNMVGLAFWIWSIIDCATKEPSDGNDKIVWLLVIILTDWIGALIYFFVRRPQRIQRYGR